MSPLAGRRGGFTLVEALVALAVAALVGVIAAAALRGERGQAAMLTDVLARRTAVDLAAELLSEEIGLAGSSPLSALVWQPGGHEPGPWSSETHLAVGLAGSGAEGEDTLGLSFFDERVAGPPLLRRLTFESAADGSGTWQLYRRPDGASRQPLVEGVSGLSVIGLVGALEADGWWSAGSLLGLEPRPVSGIVVVIHAGDVARPLLIDLPNRPRAVVTWR